MKKYALSIVAIALTAYASVYFFCFETSHTKFLGDYYKIRLFSNKYQLMLWYPLIKIEGAFTPKDVMFYGHVRNGASVPYDTDEE